MTILSAQRFVRVFVEIADTLVDEFDLIDFLHLLTSRTSELLEGSPVGLLLADPQGRLEFVAASDENVKLLELFQVQNQEGPCLDAYRSGAPVVNADLGTAANTWPRFAPQAVAAGFRAVHAFPLRLRNERIGALNVFHPQAGAQLEPANADIVQALADVAAIGLLQERAISRGELLAEQLHGALNSRIIIEQAKGAIAQAHGIHVDQAFTWMRDHARRHQLRLGDVALTIVNSPDGIAELSPTTDQQPRP